MFNQLFYPERNKTFSIEFINVELKIVFDSLVNDHDGLYKNEVLDLIHKVRLFGLHFAGLDIRQDSRIHHKVFNKIVSHPDILKYTKNLPKNYLSLSTEERCKSLIEMTGDIPPKIFKDELTYQTLESIRIMQKIQSKNGERGCNRYIISNCQTLENILELFAMCR